MELVKKNLVINCSLVFASVSTFPWTVRMRESVFRFALQNLILLSRVSLRHIAFTLELPEPPTSQNSEACRGAGGCQISDYKNDS